MTVKTAAGVRAVNQVLEKELNERRAKGADFGF
jgi:hypothetical protein